MYSSNVNGILIKILEQESIHQILLRKSFHQRDGKNNQDFHNDSFCSSFVTCAQSNNGAEKYPNAGVNLN